MSSPYSRQIEQLTDVYPAALIETWMRLAHGVLEGLSSAQFEESVRAAIDCIEAVGVAATTELAVIHGLLDRSGSAP